MKRTLFALTFSLAMMVTVSAQDVPGAVKKLNEAIALLQPPPSAPAVVTVQVQPATAQQDINNAPAGSVLVLQAGAIYPALTLAGDGAGKQLTSATPPAVVSHLTITGSHYIVRGVTFQGDGVTSEVVDCAPSAAHIVIDGNTIRGAGVNRRGIALNCADARITNNDIRGFAASGVETQAIAGWLGPGPYWIEGNYLEAASENIIFGGGDPSVANLIPSDITIIHNTLIKPAVWRGQSLNAKNLLELKNARRVRIEDNDLSGSWRDGQVGFAIVLTVRNQDGACSWCTVQDVVVRNNRLSAVGAGIQLLGLDDSHPSVRGDNWVIDGNTIAMAPQSGDAARLFQIGDAPSNLVITNNKEILTGYANTFVTVYGLPFAGFTFTGNETFEGEYGLFGDGAPGLGKVALDFYNPAGYTWSNNIVHRGGYRTIAYPVGTTLVP